MSIGSQILLIERAVPVDSLGNLRGRGLAFVTGMSHDRSPQRQRTIQLQERTFRFAAAVLQECPERIGNLGAFELWRQLVKAAPSSSHNLVEADEASSTADFIAKMKITLREAKEAHNCLRFLVHCQLTPRWEQLVALEDEARQLSLIFATILIRVRRRYASEKNAARERRAVQEFK